MKIARFQHRGAERIGVVLGNEIADVTGGAGMARDVTGMLASGDVGLRALGEAAARAPRVPLADVKLLAPIPRPPKFLAIGLNYADHIKEAKLEVPKFPVFFNKQSTCVIGPHDPIHRPRVSTML